ncbi:hypothetical protein X744_12840 [Mesorhizobium sp. LNJC372A00]|nr:hypothetical protein X745_04200 [Mesorhizobium sp. LNJC374B00]ESY59438.1 hypothetical protein X744_12840 [Mesorhizobium sp. LNJC372A00]
MHVKLHATEPNRAFAQNTDICGVPVCLLPSLWAALMHYPDSQQVREHFLNRWSDFVHPLPVKLVQFFWFVLAVEKCVYVAVNVSQD